MAAFLKSVSNSGVEGREKMREGKTQIQKRDLVILSRVMTPGGTAVLFWASTLISG